MSRRKCSKIPLCDYADPLVKDLRLLLPAALKDFDEEAIHESRVATRRLRAALDLIEPMLSSKAAGPLRKTLKRLRRRLGPLRDLDVMIQHLGPLHDSSIHGEAARWLVDRLEARRRDERHEAARKGGPEKWAARLDAWDELRGDVTSLGDAVETRMRSSMLAQWEAFAMQANHLSAELLHGAPGAACGELQTGNLSSADPHELRIAGKLLRYTFEMLAGTRHPPPAKVKRTFKRMQNELGLWHDHVVLAERTMRESLDAQVALHDPALQGRILALATSTLRTARRRLARFARIWRTAGPELSHLVLLAGSVRQVRQSETDPDLFGSGSPPDLELPPAGATGAA